MRAIKMMGLLARMFGTETRSAALPSDPYWANFAAARGIGAPTADAILSSLAVATRCVALRSELLASVPLFLFRRTADGGRERADDNPLDFVLHDVANGGQSAFEFRELLIRCLDLFGNSFARIERNARGQVTALWPLLPGDVQVDRLANGRLRYRIYNGTRTEVLLQEEVLHIRAATRDGVMGLSPIAVARGSLALALAHTETAAALSQNSLRPSGLLTYPNLLRQEQKQSIRDQAASVHGGTQQAGRMMVIDAGAKYEPLSFSPEDAQFLETRKLANEDVARIFGVPPTSVGLVDRATYSNVEQESRLLVQNSLGPLAGRIEAAMQRCLLTDVGRPSLYIEHDLNGLLRGDVKSRFDAYRLAREIGVYSANDVRRKENEPPIPKGDDYHMPVNWAPLGTTPVGAQGAMSNAASRE
jgi:HK97 family phage portal protein